MAALRWHMPHETVIRELLQRFARAFTSGDGPGAAACWEVPALVAGPQGNRAVTSLDEIAAFFGGAKAQYNAHGVTGTRPDIQRIESHGESMVAVTVDWPWLDAEGRQVGQVESSTYLVRITGGEAGIFAVLMIGERAA